MLPSVDQAVEPVVQPLLCLPRDRANLRRNPHASLSQCLAYPRWPPIVPRRFDQHMTHMSISCLRDRALTSVVPGRPLRGNQTDIAHEIGCRGEPPEVPDLGD